MSEQSVVLCQDCDLVIKNVAAKPGKKVSCPRCGAVLYEVSQDAVSRVLAYSVTGLVLYIPANVLPLLSLDILGRLSHASVLDGVHHLLKQGFIFTGMLVFFTSLFIPLIDLLVLFIVSLSLKLKRWRLLAISLLKYQGYLEGWGMLEVFMLAILIAFIKLQAMGNLIISNGLICFVGLWVCTVLSMAAFNRHQFWEAVDDIPQRYGIKKQGEKY